MGENVTTIDIDQLAKDSEVKTKITSIKCDTAANIFGDKAKTPERILLVIKTDTHSEEAKGDVISLPLGLKYENGKFEVTDKAALSRSVSNKQSKMRSFLKAYKNQLPAIGMEVYMRLDDNGFYTLRM